jgi:hypothetical protein
LYLQTYSLTPQQSSRISADAEKLVSHITEEFCPFCVKAEMTRKQMDAQIWELQSSNVEAAKMRIEGKHVVEKELEVARTEHSQLEQTRSTVEGGVWSTGEGEWSSEEYWIRSSFGVTMATTVWSMFERNGRNFEQVENGRTKIKLCLKWSQIWNEVPRFKGIIPAV